MGVLTRNGSRLNRTEWIAAARFVFGWASKTGGVTGAGVGVGVGAGALSVWASKSTMTRLWSDGLTPLSSNVPNLFTTLVLLKSRRSGMFAPRTVMLVASAANKMKSMRQRRVRVFSHTGLS